jgi:hypothetical protein
MLDFAYSGLRMNTSSHLPPDWTAIKLPAYSQNRSKRQWKKLREKVLASAEPRWSRIYVINGQMFCHPTVARELRETCSRGHVRSGGVSG